MIFVVTDPEQDLRDCGGLNTDASRADFARAYVLAGKKLAKAGGFELRVLASTRADERDAFARRTPRALRPLAGEIWQALHESVTPGARSGRWRVAVRTATQWKEIGRRYRVALAAALAAPEQDEN